LTASRWFYLHRFDARERGSGWAAIDATTTPS
jgi:hypothetical protein